MSGERFTSRPGGTPAKVGSHWPSGASPNAFVRDRTTKGGLPGREASRPSSARPPGVPPGPVVSGMGRRPSSALPGAAAAGGGAGPSINVPMIIRSAAHNPPAPVHPPACGTATTSGVTSGGGIAGKSSTNISPPGVDGGGAATTSGVTSGGGIGGGRGAGDEVIFAESPLQPGVPIIYRPPNAREASPERLNLDRRNLTQCCRLEGEDKLRLLNYQHNHITKISHLQGLSNLVFLDMYANQLESIGGLESVPMLRVLMLGRNKITEIGGLDGLRKLDVLDLHNNQISKVEGLSHLRSLRILNLAGNAISELGTELSTMTSLTEINLRRNSISSILPEHFSPIDISPSDASTREEDAAEGFQFRGWGGWERDMGPGLLPSSVQRLFLSHNQVESLPHVAPIGGLARLSELALDGNPMGIYGVSQSQAYRHAVLELCTGLQSLDVKPVNEEEKKHALEGARKAAALREREATIARVRREWSAGGGGGRAGAGGAGPAGGAAAQPSGDDPGGPSPSGAAEEGSASETDTLGAAASAGFAGGGGGAGGGVEGATAGGREKLSFSVPSAPALGGGGAGGGVSGGRAGYAELHGSGELHIFGSSLGVLKPPHPYAAIEHLEVKYVHFSEVAAAAHHIAELPSLRTLLLQDNAMSSLVHLDALAPLVRLRSLTIRDNPVSRLGMFHMYAAHVLPLLQALNGRLISTGDRTRASNAFGPLSREVEAGESRPYGAALSALTAKSRGLGDGSALGLPDRVDPVAFSDGCTAAGKMYVATAVGHAKDISEKIEAMNRIWPVLVERFISEGLQEGFQLPSPTGHSP